MAIAPLQPHSSWYRRYWYAKRSPLDTLVDRVLIFGVIALILLAGASRLAHHDGSPPARARAPITEAAL
ncbi:MAG: hypothetical protein WDN25_11245 [Acetobacteraceae bacterium]